jgi:lysophospholipase L1-like esterase
LYQLAIRNNVIPILTISSELFQLGNYSFKNAHDEFMSFCTSKNYHCVDLFEAFKGKETHELWARTRNGHPNKKGNNIVARLLADYISRLLYKNGVLN